MNTKLIDLALISVPGFAYMADMAQFKSVVVLYLMTISIATFMSWRDQS